MMPGPVFGRPRRWREARQQLIAERLAAQQLSGAPAGSSEAVVQRLLAVQAQDAGAGARLVVRSRSEGLTGRRCRRRIPQSVVQDAGHHVAEPRHTPPGERRRLLVAASAHYSADRDDQSSAPPSGRRERRASRARGRGGGRRGAGLTGRRRAGEPAPARGRRRTDRGRGVHPRARGRVAARRDRAWSDARRAEHALVVVSDWLGDAPEPLDPRDALVCLARSGTPKGTARPTPAPREVGGADARRRSCRVRWHPLGADGVGPKV